MKWEIRIIIKEYESFTTTKAKSLKKISYSDIENVSIECVSNLNKIRYVYYSDFGKPGLWQYNINAPTSCYNRGQTVYIDSVNKLIGIKRLQSSKKQKRHFKVCA